MTPDRISIDIRFDREAGVFIATAREVGLAVESSSLEGLLDEIRAAVPALLAPG